jgi:hypothetical protein
MSAGAESNELVPIAHIRLQIVIVPLQAARIDEQFLGSRLASQR